MSQLIDKFNQGELTSETITRQFTPEFVTKAVVEMPVRKRFFSKMSNKIAMPKHKGDKVTKVVTYPILHKDNMISGGVDATTATLIQNEYFIVDEAGDVVSAVGAYKAEDFMTDAQKKLTDKADIEAALVTARAAAKAAAEGDAGAGETVKSGAGSILNGAASYMTTAGSLVPLPEEGGVVNLMNGSSKLVSANITHHAVGTKYTVRSVDLDSRQGQVAQKLKDLSRAVGEIKEMQVQASIQAAAKNNSMIVSADGTGSTFSDITGKDVLTYDDLVAFEQELIRNDVPMDTEMLTGVDLTDTRVIEDSFIAYIPLEVVPTLRNMKGPGDTIVWIPKSQYGAGTEIMEGEVGQIGAFRFVVVPDLNTYKGFGEVLNAGVNSSSTYPAYTSVVDAGGTPETRFDVFPMIVVGDDSFSVAGMGFADTSARHIPPVADVHNDMHAEVGGMSAKWTYGFLNYRPERIAMLAFAATRSGRMD